MSEAQLVKAHIIMGRKEHAARINEAWQKTVDGVIETGLRILDARHGSDALEHGQFQKMLTEDLHFDASTGRRLMSIASNKVLSNRSHVHALPAKWGTLYELTVIENRGYDLETGIASGAIHPKMERKDVKALLPPPQRYDDLEEAEEDDDEVRAETSAEERKASYVASEDDDDFDEETHRLVRRAIEFTSGYIKGFKAWRKTANVSDEGRRVLADALHQCANELSMLAQELQGCAPTDHDAVDIPPEITPKKRGRPKGSKNKPKPVVEPTTAADTDQGTTVGLQNGGAPPNDDLGIPEFLRRTSAAS